MKKYVITLLLASLALSGCSDNANSSGKKTLPPTPINPPIVQPKIGNLFPSHVTIANQT